MDLLIESTAEKCFDEIIRIHKIDGLSIDDKHALLRIHVLNIVLEEITQSKDFKSQMDFLKNKYGKTIPYIIISEIYLFVHWRNQAEHPNSNDMQPEEIDYLKNIKILAKTIDFFSDVEIPEEVNILYAGRDEVQERIENEQEKTQKAIRETEAERKRVQRRINKLNKEKLEAEIAERQRQEISDKKRPVWQTILIIVFSLFVIFCLFSTSWGRVILIILAIALVLLIYYLFKD